MLTWYGQALNVEEAQEPVEVLINIGSKEENKKLYDKLFQNKEDIENSYGEPLTWERLDDKKSARITHRMFGVDVTNREDWNKIKDFLCEAMVVPCHNKCT